MKIIRFGLFFAVINFSYAKGCLIGEMPSQPRYVCFDGRVIPPFLTEAKSRGLGN
ncbi:MAG: hypothetical protein ACRCXC_08885 [Legionella sp.]